MKYLYNTGLVIGRFQTFHKGHEFLIRHALKLCETVCVYIGSSQESGTKTNPFSYHYRVKLITSVFTKEAMSGRLLMKPLPDMGIGNDIKWGLYVLDRIKQDFGVNIDLYITGCEKERSSWFTNEIAPHMDELRLTRHNIEVSATDCRNAMLNGNIRGWKQLVPKQLHQYYGEMLEKLRSLEIC